MKVKKTSAPPTFQPIELTITIESKEEWGYFKHLCQNSSNISRACDVHLDINSDAAFMLESLLDDIGESL